MENKIIYGVFRIITYDLCEWSDEMETVKELIYAFADENKAYEYMESNRKLVPGSYCIDEIYVQ